MRRIRPFPFDRLTRLARAQVEAGRALLAHLPLAPRGPETAWSEAQAALGGPVEIRLVEAYAFPRRELPSRLGAGVIIRLAGRGERHALLVLDPALAPRLARRLLGVEGAELAAPRPLTPAEQGALAFLAAALVDGEPLRVETVVGDREGGRLGFPDPWAMALEARLETPVGDGWARLLAPAGLGLELPAVHRLGAGPERGRTKRLEQAQVALRMEVGWTRVARAELARLETGDVLLFDHFGPRPPFGGPVSLCLGAGAFAAQLGGDGLTVLGHYQLGVSRMDNSIDPPPPPPDDSTTDALLRELPVEVVCELGRVTMTGREVLELRPGAVIPVGRPLAGPVDLTVGGRVFARGELVDVEGEIGVRLVQVNE